MYASEVLAETPGWSGKVTERGMARSDTPCAPCGTDAGFESVKRVAHRELRRFARKARSAPHRSAVKVPLTVRVFTVG